MLTKRIIPCLDVKDNVVVKGVRFRNHRIVGSIVDLALRYRDAGADELVFYDITASSDGHIASAQWIGDVARILDIPFCVAGGIRSTDDAERLLNAGADKISINSPALERPELITEIAELFGSQCVVVGIDSLEQDGRYCVHQYTGNPDAMQKTRRDTIAWAKEAAARGCGEIVLNCMNQDGVRQGYDITQLRAVRAVVDVPLIASGGAGAPQHFIDVFCDAAVDGALAAGVFHSGAITIDTLKKTLYAEGIAVRL